MPALNIKDLNNGKKDLDHIAEIATSKKVTATDRFGIEKQTVTGAVNTLKAFNTRGAFVPGAVYAMKDVYTSGGIAYVALADHVASTVAADLAAGKVVVHQGATREDLASAGGASLIGFLRAGAGSVLRSILEIFLEQVRVKDFGAMCDDDDGNGTDDTAAFQRAVNSVAAALPFQGSYAAVEITLPSRAKVHLAGTVFVPSFVRINLNGSVLRGTGTNTMFESGYFNEQGQVVSNFGQPNETQFVVGSKIYNGSIYQCNRAFKLFNFCEDSEVDKIRLVGVNQAIYAKRCFYGSFTRLHSRSPLDDVAFPCFHFDDAINAVTLKSDFAVGYNVGWHFSGSKDGVYASTCGAEACATGVKVSNATSGLHLHHWYFENCFNAIDCDATGNHENVVVTLTWFNSVVNAIQGYTIVSGEFAASNKLKGDVTVSLGANFSNRMKVCIPTDVTADNADPVLPNGYTLGDANLVDYVKTIYSSVTGLVSTKGRIHGGVIPHCYSGDSGTPALNTVPFCTATINGGTLTVDTKIRYLNTEFIGVQMTVNDSNGAQVVAGLAVAGVFLDLSKPETIAVNPINNNGYYRFTFSGFSSVTNYAGVVRIL